MQNVWRKAITPAYLRHWACEGCPRQGAGANLRPNPLRGHGIPPKVRSCRAASACPWAPAQELNKARIEGGERALLEAAYEPEDDAADQQLPGSSAAGVSRWAAFVEDAGAAQARPCVSRGSRSLLAATESSGSLYLFGRRSRPRLAAQQAGSRHAPVPRGRRRRGLAWRGERRRRRRRRRAR